MNKYFFLFIFLSGIFCFAQYEDSGTRGIYFEKKTYSGTVLPTYESSKAKLPEPVLEDNTEWLALYWRAWELAFDHFRNVKPGSPFVSDYIDEAFSFSVFQWDTIFMIMFARYAHHIFPSIESLDNFYCRQYENGYICREIQEADGADFVFIGREHTVNPPLFTWAELENAKLSGDLSRLKVVLPVIEKYTEWLEQYRKKAGTVHGLYWQTGLGSGMDNTPRTGSGWIDMSVQMYMLYKDMAHISNYLELSGKSERYEKKSQEIAASINKYMWNEEDGTYYDVDDEGRQMKAFTIASFWPLLANVCSEDQAIRLVAHLRNPKTFWRPIPFPSLAADHPMYKPEGAYWEGGVWAPTNLMVIKGLMNYNQDLFAYLAAENYLNAISAVFKKTGTIWENYAPEALMPGIPAQPDFVGWSGNGPITMLIENIIGIRADALGKIVVWHVQRIDRHGLNNLRFGNCTASFLCERRKSVTFPAQITVTSDAPFTLIIKTTKEEKTIEIHAGSQSITTY